MSCYLLLTETLNDLTKVAVLEPDYLHSSTQDLKLYTHFFLFSEVLKSC